MPQHAGNLPGGAHYLDEWRSDVNQQLDDSARMLQTNQIILERLTNHLDDLERRTSKLESAPAERERQVVGIGGLVGQGFYILLSAMAIIIALLAPHVAFH